MFWIRSGLHSISISDWLTAGPAVAQASRDDTQTDGRAKERKRPDAPRAGSLTAHRRKHAMQRRT